MECSKFAIWKTAGSGVVEHFLIRFVAWLVAFDDSITIDRPAMGVPGNYALFLGMSMLLVVRLGRSRSKNKDINEDCKQESCGQKRADAHNQG